jgi:O-antigen/teichoic acid export membrane protein
MNQLTLSSVLLVFILADASEILLGGFLTYKILRIPVQWHVNMKAYVSFCKAALPQVGIVIFASALARADWILIGLFLSPAKLAEYSFAYKAFEICSLPLLVVAPLLVPWFTRIIKTVIPLQQHPQIQLLLRVEIIVACFVALCLNLLWNPFVDGITGGKYGAVNTSTIFILSMTLPVLYLNNFLWSLHFAYGNLTTILFSFILSFLLNVMGNILLLPKYGNEGAALAYFVSILTQTLFYASRLKEQFSGGMFVLAACSLCAFLSGYLSPLFTANVLLLLVFGTAFYIVFLVCTVQIHQKDLKLLWKIITG